LNDERCVGQDFVLQIKRALDNGRQYADIGGQKDVNYQHYRAPNYQPHKSAVM